MTSLQTTVTTCRLQPVKLPAWVCYHKETITLNVSPRQQRGADGRFTSRHMGTLVYCRNNRMLLQSGTGYGAICTRNAIQNFVHAL